MLTLLIVLAALGFAAAIGGAVWWIVGSGQTRTRSGPEVGAEIMAGLGEADGDDEGRVEVVSVSGHAFKGQGIKTEGAAETSFGEVKAQMRAGRWREALPPLTAATGILAVVLFGSLALLVGLEDKLIGGILAAVGLYAVARLAYDFVKA